MDVVGAVANAATLHPTLSGIYGKTIRSTGFNDHVVPCLEYTLISNVPGVEIWEPIVIQWDQFVKTNIELYNSEQALMMLFSHQNPVLLNGVYMWSMFVEGAQLAAPMTHGYYGRALRFRFTPVMSEYVSN